MRMSAMVVFHLCRLARQKEREMGEKEKKTKKNGRRTGIPFCCWHLEPEASRAQIRRETPAK
jgi:hypothetical protein